MGRPAASFQDQPESFSAMRFRKVDVLGCVRANDGVSDRIQCDLSAFFFDEERFVGLLTRGNVAINSKNSDGCPRGVALQCPSRVDIQTDAIACGVNYFAFPVAVFVKLRFNFFDGAVQFRFEQFIAELSDGLPGGKAVNIFAPRFQNTMRFCMSRTTIPSCARSSSAACSARTEVCSSRLAVLSATRVSNSELS